MCNIKLYSQMISNKIKEDKKMAKKKKAKKKKR